MNVAIIPARGGSRRIPRKNIRDFHGKPIIAYSIEAALHSGMFERVLVSTEDEEIARIAMDLGAMWHVRPEVLAEDEIGTQEVARDAIVTTEHFHPVDYACCIYATAPLITPTDLQAAFGRLRMAARWPYVYVPGWYYFGVAFAFRHGIPLADGLSADIDKPERVIDINTEHDWKRAEEMYAALHEVSA